MKRTNGYLDCAKPGDEAAYAQLSANIAEAYPGYQFGERAVAGTTHITAPPDGGLYLIMQPGHSAHAKMVEGPPYIDRGHFIPTALDQGDLIHLPPNATAEIHTASARFWDFCVQGSVGDFIYKAGITQMRFCTNTKGGCNLGGVMPNPHRDFRKMLYSGHDEVVRIPSGFVPKIELHVPLINATTSTPHWHPERSRKDGKPQHETYLMLDHRPFGLEVDHVPSKLQTFPDPLDKQTFNEWDVTPGQAWSIFTRTGHQLYGGLVIVVAFPARFDLDNEIPVGQASK